MHGRKHRDGLILEYGGGRKLSTAAETSQQRTFAAKAGRVQSLFTPFGQLPVMVVDGEVIAQSGSIVPLLRKARGWRSYRPMPLRRRSAI